MDVLKLCLICIFAVLGEVNAELCSEMQYLTAHEEVAQLSSPNYPGLYPKDIECKWWIYTREVDYDIHLRFIHLDIEDSDDCINDILTVNQSATKEEKIVDVCGNSTNQTLLKLGADVRLIFKTNNETEGTGFVIEYFIVEDEHGENEKSRYTNYWGIVLLVVFIVIAVAVIIATIVACKFARKRQKEKETRNVYAIGYSTDFDEEHENDVEHENDDKERIDEKHV
ncbi:CUB domain containing protein 2 [Mactra antiquata]